ncbi:MAG: hypothetical protein M1827_000147 [Pycnora praestabilis]|nr:MAG: hypothetical protein M1827_000147 [Pycnora praestabilis]
MPTAYRERKARYELLMFSRRVAAILAHNEIFYVLASKSPSDQSVGDEQGGKAWQVPRRGDKGSSGQALSIESGDTGIWATCEKGKEGKCVGELRDLFDKFAKEFYNANVDQDNSDAEVDDEDGDIEAEIQREVKGMQNLKTEALFKAVKLDIPCVLFFKTQKPVEPVTFVEAICNNAISAPGNKHGRWVKRLTPMTLMGKATEKGLEEVAMKVLAPHFRSEDKIPKKASYLFSAFLSHPWKDQQL